VALHLARNDRRPLHLPTTAHETLLAHARGIVRFACTSGGDHRAAWRLAWRMVRNLNRRRAL
jgi:hypothetical protein